MKLKHLKTILPPLDGAAKITAMAWSSNNIKLAVCTSDRVILLFDEMGERRDKFSTKPADPKSGKRSYIVKALAFSPDSSKLAVGQTDNIIYIYKLGEEWGDKKVICNKFVQQSAVTCLTWVTEGPLVMGLSDGKVRLAHMNTNKTQTAFATESFVVAVACNSKGTGFISGHADGTIVRYYVVDEGNGEHQGKICIHPVPPYALAWPASGIVAAGCDQRVVMYGPSGQVLQQFDYSRDETEKEFTVACSSPSGHAVAVGSFDRIRIFIWTPRKSQWEESPKKDVPHLYTISTLAWKKDGSRIACGTLCGSVEIFESVLKRSVWKNKFELTYVGTSQVLVKPLTSGTRGVILRSKFGCEIEDVRILGKERYLVARTTETILLGDLQRNLLSEIPWGESGGNEKFYFDNPSVCMIFNAGELTLVEYGNNEILGSVRTEFMNPHLISVRINERKVQGVEDNKRLAYLLDLKTICLEDLVIGISLGQVIHDAKVDWLELNETGRKLLYRDKKMCLVLVDIESLTKTSILNYCTFVQWVPCSDVVVAQSRTNLCIWYNIESPERVNMISIKGEVVEISKEAGKTEVVVQESHQQLCYPLDEGLIEFGTAIEDGDYIRAVIYLESLPLNSESEAMWRSLGSLALDTRNLTIAEQCAASVGDVAKSQYLRNTIALADKMSATTGTDGMNSPEVWARLAILDKQFKAAEGIYLEQNQLEKALDMYMQLHKWEEALSLAEAKGHPKLETLKQNYYQWLLDTHQEEKAGERWENEGEYNTALNMYLKAGLPVRASRLVQGKDSLTSNPDVVNRVGTALLQGEFYEQAGELYERVNQHQKALDCYRKAQAFARAIELARYAFPTEVVKLEEEWGDYLVTNKQLDAAINHYIEAGKTIKALEAAINSSQWKKAVQIIQVIDDAASVAKYYFRLGQHFAAIQDYASAEKFYLDGGMCKEAIDMYNQAGQWEKAHRLASHYMQSDEVAAMYISQAQNLEQQGRLLDAEKLYVSVNEPDLAITMYKKNRQYDQMMRMVTQYHPDLVQTTHIHLAQELESENNLRAAEQHYLSAGDWKGAVNMYRLVEMWEDAYRIGKTHGGTQAGKQVAFLWARSLGGDSAVKLLTKFGLLEHCIDYACESYQFEFAFDLARTAMKNKMPTIHYKYAMALEDEGKFKEAEDEFILSDKPKEAVLMYVHNQDWENAQRVAETHDPDSVSDVLLGQAKVAFQDRNYQRFESLLLRAQFPEVAVKYYQEAGMWPDALRMCREYVPHRLQALQEEYEHQIAGKSGEDVEQYLSQAREWEENADYMRAVECYMKVNKPIANDVDVLNKAWGKAADIAVKFLDNNKATQIAEMLGPRYIGIRNYNAAAQLYLNVDLIKEAIDAFIAGEEWAKARKVARELEPRYESYVDSSYKEYLKIQGRAEQLADVDLIGALDLLVEQGQWQKCLEKAQQHSPQVQHKYIALYATHLIKSGNAIDALQLYVKHGAPALAANYNIYRHLATHFFSAPHMNTADSFQTWVQLRDVIYEITENLNQSADAGSQLHKEFETLLLIAHFYTCRSAFHSSPQLDKLVAKLSASLLRYTDIIAADKAYYEAGLDCRAAGLDNMAFVFLNRYLDVHEAIEERSLDSLDNTDFVNTDIPFEIPLPDRPFLSEEQHEEIKEWVLAVSMDQRVEQVLPIDERGLYEASLLNRDKTKSPPCIVSGYPVFRNRVEFKKGGRVANSEDWNKLVMAAKVGEGMSAVPLHNVLQFISQIGGGVPNYAFK